jgi:hypothetical protein
VKALVIAAQRLRVYRRPLLVWTVSLAALGAFTVLAWPAVRDASGLEELVANLPEAMRALVGSDDLTSPEGFVNSRLASVFPLLITIYAAFRIADEVAGEEQAGGFEVLLGHPLARWELVAGVAAAVAVSVGVLMAGTGVAMVLAGAVVDIGIPLGRMLAATTALTFLGWSSLGIALAVAGATGAPRRHARDRGGTGRRDVLPLQLRPARSRAPRDPPVRDLRARPRLRPALERARARRVARAPRGRPRRRRHRCRRVPAARCRRLRRHRVGV